jgi:sulfatase modifying factor 1
MFPRDWRRVLTTAMLCLCVWQSSGCGSSDDETPPPAKAQALPTTPTLKLDLGKGVSLTLARLAAGEFDMGTPPHDGESAEASRDTERPVHRVKLTKPFYVGIHEVTRAQFGRFVDDEHFKTEAEEPGEIGYGWSGKQVVGSRNYNWRNPGFPQKDTEPVVLVSVGDAKSFCRWLKDRTGHNVRLPTEAEWEYAYRAGTKTAYFWGENREDGKPFANIPDASYKKTMKLGDMPGPVKFDDGFCFTAPVGSFKPNAWGLYDMQGNVWEYCDDWCTRYDLVESYVNPVNVMHRLVGGPRVTRGGSWGDELINGLGRMGPVDASRRGKVALTSYCDQGFRVVIGEQPSPAPKAP